MSDNIQTKFVGSTPEFGSQSNFAWWTIAKGSRHSGVFASVKNIESSQSSVHAMNIRHGRLYSDREFLGLLGHYPKSHGRVGRSTSSAITYNVVKSAIDTLSSKISKSKPKVQFLTDDGNWKQKNKAKKLTTYIEGVYYHTDIYEKAQMVFRDACIFGTGSMKVYTKDGRIQAERVLIDEIKVDENDGLYGKPKSIYQTKWVSRDEMISRFPKKKQQIQASTDVLKNDRTTNVDMIRVIEAWHLPTSPKARDGLRVLSISTATLDEEEYTKDYFPFLFFRWDDGIAGFFGEGIAEQLTGKQITINRLLRNIERAIHLIAIPRIAIESNVNLPKPQINNEIGAIIRYAAGTRAPQFFTPTAMNSEVYNHLQWLIDSSFEAVGVSKLSATSQKPVGLESSVALRTFQDIESGRFVIAGQRYEKMFIDMAKIIVDMSRDLYLKNPELEVVVPGSDFIKTIKWKDVDLKDDEFVMKAWPVSMLPDSPAGQIQFVQEMVQGGIIPKDAALQLLNFPDVKSWLTAETASKELIEKNINVMLDTGKYLPPEPQMNLKSAFQLANQAYLEGRISNLPEERLELLLRFTDEVERLMKIAQPEPAIVPGETGIGTAVPEAAPTSDLLPQV